MISLMFAMLANPMLPLEGQAIQATLQSCAVENNRYVCRYAVPDVVIVPVQGTNIVADAPSVVLGGGTTAVSPETLAATSDTAVSDSPAAPAAPPVTAPTAAPPTVTTTAPGVDAGPIRPIDPGVLTEREAQLVARCADAGWMSLCLPDDRRAARTLRDRQSAYLAVRRDVTRLLGEDDCDAAVRTALDGGYLALARETRDYCAAPTAGGQASAAAAPVTAEPAAAKVETDAEADTDATEG